ncbi:MAG: cob(I)yrinic acid a,c-diamide adenosyltransferase [Candidatus Alcyoniella australis]|nr:cob(I)yrinic acid a,c-diamide adenosyltransferase [Candidatus Alcyoniella australis]
MTSNAPIGRGYVQVYTGNGKGKTTAALGLALRAAGRGIKTYIGQFMKGQLYGELKGAQMLGGLVTIEQFGRDEFVHVTKPPDPRDVDKAQQCLAALRKALISGEYSIVVADEINTALWFGLLSIEQALELIKLRPEGIELVLTGRYAPESLIEAADLVTEMREVKHYYTNHVPARDGIER